MSEPPPGTPTSSDIAFRQQRNLILAKHHYVCQFCGATPCHQVKFIENEGYACCGHCLHIMMDANCQATFEDMRHLCTTLKPEAKRLFRSMTVQYGKPQTVLPKEPQRPPSRLRERLKAKNAARVP